MINAEYFRREAAKLRKLAQSIRDPERAKSISAIATDFVTRADVLEKDGVQVPVHKDGGSDGEMDRD